MTTATDFLDLSLWIFDFMVKFLLPFVSGILAIIGIYGVFTRIPKTMNKWLLSKADEFRQAMRGMGGGRR